MWHPMPAEIKIKTKVPSRSFTLLMCKEFSHFSFRSMTVFGLKKKMSDLDVLITCLETVEYQSSFSTKMYIIAGAFLAILMPQKVLDSSPSRTTRETFFAEDEKVRGWRIPLPNSSSSSTQAITNGC